MECLIPISFIIIVIYGIAGLSYKKTEPDKSQKYLHKVKRFSVIFIVCLIIVATVRLIEYQSNPTHYNTWIKSLELSDFYRIN